MGRPCSTIGAKRNADRILMGKPEVDKDVGGWKILKLILER
jgi:hypothetical protein